jgi:hypothetical protein
MDMEKMPLSKTNPYLQNPITRKKLIARSVETSCGVEGINITLTQAKIKAAQFNIPRRGNKRIYQTIVK